jgi:hypothetical protein
MGIAPEAVVAPPATTPPRHSLIESAVVIDEPAGSRWESGFTFQPENCIEGSVWNPCGTPGEIDSLDIECDGGTWTIEFDGEVSAPLPCSATASDIQTALEGLTNIDPGDVVVTGYPDHFTFTWGGQYLGVDVSGLLSANDIDLTNSAGPVVLDVTSPLYSVGEKVVKKDYDGDQTEVDYNPFIIEVPYTCSSFGFQAADYEKRAMRQLEAIKHKALEHEFWTGYINPENPSLMNSTPNDDEHVLNPGGAAAPVPVTPGVALVVLSQALANCGSGGRGMIHATPGMVERWVNLSGVQCDDSLIWTCARGDIIVDGSGYPGLGPIGQPPPGPNETWVYATGMVNIRLGDPEVFPKEFSEALDRRTNTVTYRGEMVASAVHDLCCSFAVLVDLCGTI